MARNIRPTAPRITRRTYSKRLVKYSHKGLYSRRFSEAITQHLLNKNYRVESVNKGKGRLILITGSQPLFEDPSNGWCWVGPYKDFTYFLVTEEVNAVRQLRRQYLEWLSEDGKRKDSPPIGPFKLRCHKKHKDTYQFVNPGVGKWQGTLDILAHAIATTYPNLWNFRATLARRRRWLWDEEFPADEKLMELVQTFDAGESYENRLRELAVGVFGEGLYD